MVTQNFDEAKDLDQDYDANDYQVTPSRAEFYFEDGMEEPTEVEDDLSGGTTEVAATAEASYDDELAAALAAQNQPETPEANDPTAAPEFAKFNEDFKKYAGVDFKEAMESFQMVRQELHNRKVEEAKQALGNDWGVQGEELDQRLTQVRERWNNLKPELKQQYDTNDGIKLIWTYIEKEQAKGQKVVPGLQRSSTKIPAGSQAKYDFSQRQIDNMSNDEYQKNSGRIMTAYANGRVKPY